MFIRTRVMVEFAAAAMDVVVTSQYAMRDAMRNQVNLAAIGVGNHFVRQIGAFVVMNVPIHADDTLYLVRKRHQVMGHDDDGHRPAEFLEQPVKVILAGSIDIVAGFVQEQDSRIAYK